MKDVYVYGLARGGNDHRLFSLEVIEHCINELVFRIPSLVCFINLVFVAGLHFESILVFILFQIFMECMCFNTKAGVD